MAQLTGRLQGTSQSDTYVGEILNGEGVIDERLVAIAATQLAVDSLGGQDTLEALVEINRNPTEPTVAQGIGITNATINLGQDSDTLTVSSSIISDLFVSQGTGTASDSTGVIRTTLDTGSGSDVVTISSLAVVINADPSNPFAEDGPSVSATSFGLVNSFVTLGLGNDEISIIADIPAARSATNTGTTEARGVSGSTILGGDGADAIAIATKATVDSGINGPTEFVRSYGAAFNASIKGGDGMDTITVDAETINGNESQTVGVGFGTTNIDGGANSDVITVSAQKTGISSDQAEVRGIFAGGAVRGGSGADTLEINAQGSVVGLSTLSVVGVEKGVAEGGAGNDAISVNISGNGGANTAYLGVFQGTLTGGSGDDAITVDVTGTATNGTSIGVKQSTLDGGSGQDSFVVRGVSLDLEDAVLKGGDGADVFDTGVGGAIISGDRGNDLLKLDFFDDTTMAIALLGTDSIRISGSTDKLGNSDFWNQTITGVERYEVAGTAYGAAEVVNLLG